MPDERSTLLRWLLRLARTWNPVFRIGGRVIVTRYDGVKEVLTRDDDFSVCILGSRMRETSGDFFLGRDGDDKYTRERQAALEAMLAVDADDVLRIANEEATAIVEQVKQEGELVDVVADIADRVPIRVVERYHGLPNPGGRILLEWLQLMSAYIFNPVANEGNRERAIRAGEAMQDHVNGVIRDLQTGARGPMTLLTRLLDGPLDDDAAGRTISGLIAGTVPPPSWLFVNAIDRLMDLPHATFGDLQKAARERDFERVQSYLLEGGRFMPSPFVVERSCQRDTELLKAGRKPETVRAGERVICLILSAVFDERAIESPHRFRIDRDREDYPLFGLGRHECIGREIGLNMLTGMAQPLLALPGLRRRSGSTGRLRKGPRGRYPAQSYPHSLILAFDRERRN